MKKILVLMLALLMVCSVFAACGGANSNETTATTEDPVKNADGANSDFVPTVKDVDYVKGKGTLIVGITDFAPMDYKDGEDWIGFDADMAKAFAEYLGVSVQFVEINWDNKVIELDGKNIDCVWNGMTLTSEVTSAMSCSSPYCNNQQIVVMKESAAADYKTVDDLKSLVFAVENGSAGQAVAEKNGFAIVETDNQAKALMEVSSGTCDAAIIDSLMAAAMVGPGTDYGNLVYTIGLNDEKYGVGFRKGSDLVVEYEAFFKEAVENGTVKDLAATYGITAALINE